MKRLLVISVVFLFLQCHMAMADVQADHEALRTLRTQATAALNANNFDQLAPLLDKNFTLTTVDNHKFTNLQDFKSYWSGLFSGEKAILKSITVDPEADALTEFLAPTVGLVHGTSTDTYLFTDGDVRKMHTRWTAVVKQEADGWKIVALHFSANLLDNPVLDAVKAKACWYAMGGVIAGFILGILVMLIFKSRRSST